MTKMMNLKLQQILQIKSIENVETRKVRFHVKSVLRYLRMWEHTMRIWEWSTRRLVERTRAPNAPSPSTPNTTSRCIPLYIIREAAGSATSVPKNLALGQCSDVTYYGIWSRSAIRVPCVTRHSVSCTHWSDTRGCTLANWLRRNTPAPCVTRGTVRVVCWQPTWPVT